VELSADGKRFAASTAGQVWLLDPERFPAPTTRFDDPLIDFFDDPIVDMVMNPEGTLLVVSTEEGQVVSIDLPRGGTKTLINNGPSQHLALSADGNSLILASEDGLVQTRSLGSGTDGILWQADEPIFALSNSSTNLLAIGLEEKVILFDMNSSQVMGELTTSGRNELLQFDPSGSLLVINSDTGLTSFWRMEAGVFELSSSFRGDPAISMSFTPDGSRLFLGGTDKVFIYDSTTEIEINRIREKGETIDLAFSPDGGTLYAASLRTLRLFDLTAIAEITSEDVISTACSRAIQNFTASEWQSFFGDEEYKSICPSLPVP
jgi:WD40 repeat protein